MKDELERIKYELEDACKRGVSKVSFYCEYKEYIQTKLGGKILPNNKGVEFKLR
tara:strand:+ start:9777 stop:9938 length:162 start_codon:yes stop_codon:yes gene_type:complete